MGWGLLLEEWSPSKQLAGHPALHHRSLLPWGPLALRSQPVVDYSAGQLFSQISVNIHATIRIELATLLDFARPSAFWVFRTGCRSFSQY